MNNLKDINIKIIEKCKFFFYYYVQPIFIIIVGLLLGVLITFLYWFFIIGLFILVDEFYYKEEKEIVNVFSESDFIKDYFENTEYRNVSNVIVAMSRLETGHYKSKAHISRHNYFSYKDFKHPECKSKPIYCLKIYRTIEESCKDLLDYLRRKNYSTESSEEFYKDLIRNHYAEDENYINILRKIKAR